MRRKEEGAEKKEKRRTIILAWNDMYFLCNRIHYTGTLHDVRLHLVRFHLTQTDRLARSVFFHWWQKPGARVKRKRRYYRTSTYCAARIILCKSHYSRLTALQPTVMYSTGRFMQLYGIIPDLTHYCGELGATIRTTKHESTIGCFYFKLRLICKKLYFKIESSSLRNKCYFEFTVNVDIFYSKSD